MIGIIPGAKRRWYIYPAFGEIGSVMNHADHVRLLCDGVTETGGTWADFGSGRGAFTLALADLIGLDGTIYSIDRSGEALRDQEREMKARFPGVTVHYRREDFNSPMKLPALDGVVMANALHFQRDKERTLGVVQSYLKPHGKLILVEYNTDRGNTWVPYPLSFDVWLRLAQRCGFSETRLLTRAPSSFLGEFYSAVSWKP